MADPVRFGLGLAPKTWMGKPAQRLTDWGGQLLKESARRLAGPGHAVRATFLTSPNDQCQHRCGCNYFTILAVDNQDTDYLWGEYFDNSATQTVPDGIVLRIPRCTIFEIPTNWNPPEFADVVSVDGSNQRLAVTGPGQNAGNYIDLGDPTDWKVPRLL